jgi:hypothetical protein
VDRPISYTPPKKKKLGREERANVKEKERKMNEKWEMESKGKIYVRRGKDDKTQVGRKSPGIIQFLRRSGRNLIFSINIIDPVKKESEVTSGCHRKPLYGYYQRFSGQSNNIHIFHRYLCL